MAKKPKWKQFADKSLLRYAIGGAFTTLWNLGLFELLLYMGINYMAANLAAIVTTKIWAYFVNKFFVFKSHRETTKELFLEIASFIAARSFTMVVDFFALILFTEVLGINAYIGKILVIAIVVVLNYLLERFGVFRKSKKAKSEEELSVAEVYQPEGNYYNKYESQNPIAKRLTNGFFKHMDELLQKITFSTVYEAGCGEGYVSSHIKACFPHAEISAPDLSEDKINQAKIDFPQVEFAACSIYDLPYPDASFDLAIASEVLEHMENPEKALQEVMRISSRYVLVSVPNEPIWRVCNMARGKYIKDGGNTPGHIQHWSKKSFRDFVGRHCTVLEVRSPFPWTMLLCKKHENT